MASIFTFGNEPSRVCSPWPPAPPVVANGSIREEATLAGMKLPQTEILAGCGISKLEAEPQEGPTEYKLHLLLRPRRSFSSTSTVRNVSGSHLSKSRAPPSHSETDIQQAKPSPALAPSSQSRQNRLQHLTTQLLWRLQQSSPYHSSSRSSLVLPVLPEADVKRSSSMGPGPLIPGLEESSGALYEIGVSDDGTFVGLARDELEESLTVLRAMAFSLGCNVQILRMIIVGDCQWTEEIESKTQSVKRLRREKLWVAEMLVAPTLSSQSASPNLATLPVDNDQAEGARDRMDSLVRNITESESEQLRISLTGSTTSGKSSLLGTLSTSTLDNGRGKSRLSLLKHRHEIVSGVTSSIAQELIGYQDTALSTGNLVTKVINYASGNVSSWEDIHSASKSGRLVFVTDSAGHPRYKRTMVRGLVSWAPNWTLCCVAADDQEDSSGKIGATASAGEVLGAAGVGTDLSKAHLELCLKLDLPLVIVITKLDLATKTGLRDTLAKVLTTLKSAGRKPAVLSSTSREKFDPQLQSIDKDDEEVVRRTITSVQPKELQSLVPIVLTSAVTGSGIGKLHALLRQLPIKVRGSTTRSSVQPHDEARPPKLFHVDEVFAMPPKLSSSKTKSSAPTSILSGYLQYGSLNVGDSMLIGPCNSDDTGDIENTTGLPRSRSYPGVAKESPRAATLAHELQKSASRDLSNKSQGPANRAQCAQGPQVWREIRIASLRNLRLPVRTLAAGQAGTLGISPCDPGASGTTNSLASELCIRRGMVILPILRSAVDGPPLPYSRFNAVFQEAGLPAWPGVLVTIYTASIRASAKIVEVRALESEHPADDVFQFDDDGNDVSGSATLGSLRNDQRTEIVFEFTAGQEWLETGTQVLVTPGGGPSLTGQPEQKEVGSAGLDGFVGQITQTAV